MQNSYHLIAEEWNSSKRQFTSRKYLDIVLSKIEPRSLVLDVGCGTGIPIGKHLIQNGCRVVGFDQSAKMLELASGAVPEMRLFQADMCAIPLRGKFAAAIAWDSMFHVERDRHRLVFRKLATLLKPGGWLLISAGGSGSPGFTSEMFGHTFFYSGFEPDETRRLLVAEGFEIALCEEDDSSSRGHIAIVAQRLE